MYGFSDESLVEEHWKMNPYFHFFFGRMNKFQWGNLMQQVVWFIS